MAIPLVMVVGFNRNCMTEIWTYARYHDGKEQVDVDHLYSDMGQWDVFYS